MRLSFFVRKNSQPTSPYVLYTDRAYVSKIIIVALSC